METHEVEAQARKWAIRLKPFDALGYYPHLKVRKGSYGASGRASFTRCILTVSPSASRANVYALILHELAHSQAPHASHHGKEWRRIYRAAVRAAFPGIKMSSSLKGHRYWGFDARIREAIRVHLENGGKVRWQANTR